MWIQVASTTMTKITIPAIGPIADAICSGSPDIAAAQDRGEDDHFHDEDGERDEPPLGAVGPPLKAEQQICHVSSPPSPSGPVHRLASFLGAARPSLRVL